jgi:hypothetical protein
LKKWGLASFIVMHPHFVSKVGKPCKDKKGEPCQMADILHQCQGAVGVLSPKICEYLLVLESETTIAKNKFLHIVEGDLRFIATSPTTTIMESIVANGWAGSKMKCCKLALHSSAKLLHAVIGKTLRAAI